MAEPEEISVINEIEKALDRRPFEPFVIEMACGERHEVTGRHAVAVGRSVAVIIPPPPATVTTVLRTSQILSVEVLSTAR